MVEAIPINLYDNYRRRAIFVVLCEFIIFTQLIFIVYSPSSSKDNTIQNDLPDQVFNETATQDNSNPTEIPTEIIPTEDPYEETTNEENSNQENDSTQPPTEQYEEVKYFDVPLEEELQNYIFKLCEESSIDPALVIAMIYRESSYNQETIGDNGKSFGLMQIQPKWHQWRMEKLNAEAHIDEIIKTSENKNKGRPNTPDENNLHGDMAKDGWRYREVYLRDNDGKYYGLTLSVE